MIPRTSLVGNSANFALRGFSEVRLLADKVLNSHPPALLRGLLSVTAAELEAEAHLLARTRVVDEGEVVDPDLPCEITPARRANYAGKDVPSTSDCASVI